MIGIVAMNRDGCIGRRGTLPWRHPEDLAFFKRTTAGGTVVMGRKTWDGLPRRPLPARDNVVITRRPDGVGEAGGIPTSVDALDTTLAGLRRPVFVIGGAEIYALLWGRIEEFLVTRVADAVAGCDAFFPRPLAPDFELVDTTPLSPACTLEHHRRRPY